MQTWRRPGGAAINALLGPRAERDAITLDAPGPPRRLYGDAVQQEEQRPDMPLQPAAATAQARFAAMSHMARRVAWRTRSDTTAHARHSLCFAQPLASSVGLQQLSSRTPGHLCLTQCRSSSFI